jgi:hypothetical protein
MTDQRMRAMELFTRSIREADDFAELERLRAMVTEIYGSDANALQHMLHQIGTRMAALGNSSEQSDDSRSRDDLESRP